MVDPEIPTLISSIGVLMLITVSIIRLLTKKNISKSEMDAETSFIQLMMNKFTPRKNSPKSTELSSVV